MDDGVPVGSVGVLGMDGVGVEVGSELGVGLAVALEVGVFATGGVVPSLGSPATIMTTAAAATPVTSAMLPKAMMI